MAEKKSDKSDAPEPEVTTGEEDNPVELSRDASFSTYSRVDQQREGEINPPPGPQTQQELGKPSEGGGTVFTAKRAGRE